ncbi:hypothetical protein PK98_01925 [Croceibacterium mercuriale]|uniref:Uncharacterized protein n=1 Tax=Croceibacterium mercuriale TaxID=1572751 RepID=A0A0B2BZZ7_9SPHN|nr:hypothetical protein [Croceibacterium mercuriale]KHL25475.1 hypothetical protein PK98_01925 [Croceibacterium mercuriale]
MILASIGEATSSAQADMSLWGADPAWLNAGPETPYVAWSLEDLYAGTRQLDDRYGSDPRISAMALQPMGLRIRNARPISTRSVCKLAHRLPLQRQDRHLLA